MQSQRTPVEELVDLLNQLRNSQTTVANVKQRAMELVRGGVDVLSCSTDWPNRTLLHFLVLSNTDGVNEQEIAELLNRDENPVNFKNGVDKTPLQDLMNHFSQDKITLKDFKRTAMQLARKGADLTIQSSEEDTLLHYLVINNNAAGVNEPEMTELLDAQAGLVNVKNGSGNTPLQGLINKFSKREIKFEDFKRTAMQLARKSADLTVKGGLGEDTLLHFLVHHNVDGVNEQEMAELLKMNYRIAHIRNKANISPWEMFGKNLSKDQAINDLFIMAALRKDRFFQAPEKRQKVHDSVDKVKHAKDRDQLRLLLQNYIARIEDHENVDTNHSINFGWNFTIFQEKQATNREANYNLARDLLDKLEKDGNVDINQLFSEENIANMRSKYITAGFWGKTIHSSELNGIISDAREMGKKEEIMIRFDK